MLHYFNAPPDCEEDQLKQVFLSLGAEIPIKQATFSKSMFYLVRAVLINVIIIFIFVYNTLFYIIYFTLFVNQFSNMITTLFNVIILIKS